MDSKQTVLEYIYEWSKTKLLWQRDALRRIIQNDQITDLDINEIYHLTKTDLAHNSIPGAKPLETEHIASHASSDKTIWLEKISKIIGVNSLASDQTLNFSAKGITIIYGENGSGKTGYTRILKNACRARHRPNIIPNIYKNPPQITMTAKIYYGDFTTSDQCIDWVNADTPDKILSAISVFDRDCASIQLKRKNKVAFQPYGLDIPDRLAEVYKQIESKINEEIHILNQQRNNIFSTTPWNSYSKIGKKITSLSKNTNINELMKDITLSSQEELRLYQLKDTLSKNIKQAEQEQRLNAENFKLLKNYLIQLNNLFSNENLNNILMLNKNYKMAKQAAHLAELDFSDVYLPDTGGELWKHLWNSAKNYSSMAYPEIEFPNTKNNSKCVLCQEILTENGKKNLSDFQNFVKGDLEKQVRTSKELFDQEFNKFIIDKTFLSYRGTLNFIKIINYNLYRNIRRFLAIIRLKKYQLNNSIHNETMICLITSNNCYLEIEALEKNANNMADELKKAEDTNELSKLKEEMDELIDRNTVQNYEHIFSVEIERLKNLDRLLTSLTDTKTTSITNLGNKIADELITPILSDKFMHEIVLLAGDRLRVEFKRSGGKFGSPEYRLSFLSAPQQDVSDILSEGEQTCVAFASFLAELETSPHKSSLVFDDPISSLDHKWRSRIAERLIDEAKIRQVIVFTHDLIFLNDLEDYAKEKGVTFYAKHLDRTPNIVGLVNDDHPWDGMKVLARIDKLEKDAKELAKCRISITDENYKIKAQHFYSRLRASWERGLEEIGLSHTVMRYRDYINPKEIKKISALDLSDCTKWLQHYGFCCDFTESHDSSRGRNKTLPEPSKLLEDVTHLKNWVHLIKEKQKLIH